MESIEEIKKELTIAQARYETLKQELNDFVYNEKKEKYGMDFICRKCRYNCLVNIVGWNNLCLKDRWANSPCKDFMPTNTSSDFIVNSGNVTDYSCWKDIAALLDFNEVSDLIDNETVFEKASKIYKIIVGVE